MKIEKKRACAITAVKKIRDVVLIEQEVEKDLRSERRRQLRKKAWKTQLPVKKSAPIPRPRKAEKKVKVLMMCAECHLPIFQHRSSTGQSSAKVCKCRQRLHYGSFWQEPPSKKNDGHQRQTFALYRSNDQCQWGKAQSAKVGEDSAAQMILKMPGGKIVFDPKQNEATCVPGSPDDVSETQ